MAKIVRVLYNDPLDGYPLVYAKYAGNATSASEAAASFKIST